MNILEAYHGLLKRIAASVTKKRYYTDRLEIQGIGAAVAYAAGDAFGTGGVVKVPKEGIIKELLFWDLDDEGLGKELALFTQRLATIPTDNAAFDPADADLRNCIGHINVAASDFADWNSNRMGTTYVPDKYYKAPQGRLFYYWITRGADNIAAGSVPLFALIIEPLG